MTGNVNVKNRREDRSAVRLYGTLQYMTAKIRCRVVDLSEQGICLRMEEVRDMAKGIRVDFRSEELGHLVGKVAWVRGNTVGLILNHTSSTYAQVKSYFRFFHQDIVPVLKS